MEDEPASGSAASASPERGGAPRRRLFELVAGFGAAAQAAVLGLYAWGVTVAPSAWSRDAPLLAKAAACVGVLALVTAPLVESRRGPSASEPNARAWGGPEWARAWSVWGLVLSSATVWVMVPASVSPARLDGVRGALGMVGWALFAFASAGPVLRSEPGAEGAKVTRSSLEPRSALPRGDGIYIGVGVVLALSMQTIGWAVSVPERAVLVRLVTVVCGIAVLGAMTSVSLQRHRARVRAPARLGLRRAMPWLVLSVVFVAGALVRAIAM